jgi:large subunit ribosomal protein L30
MIIMELSRKKTNPEKQASSKLANVAGNDTAKIEINNSLKETVKEQLLAVILIRGTINAKKDIVATLDKFKLRQRLSCSVMPDTSSNRAALQKCKDYTAFGTITDETHKSLVEKRGEKNKDGTLKGYFRLHPPRGGFERKGIKIPYGVGGALGNRKEKMNELIKRML